MTDLTDYFSLKDLIRELEAEVLVLKHRIWLETKRKNAWRVLYQNIKPPRTYKRKFGHIRASNMVKLKLKGLLDLTLKEISIEGQVNYSSVRSIVHRINKKSN